MKYAIRSTPGGLLKDARTGKTITFDAYAKAEAEAQRLTKAAYDNPAIAGMRADFTPVAMH
jgi:hypothetical protein